MSSSCASSSARASSIQRRTLTPTVMWSESESDVSAWWSQPRGRYIVSPGAQRHVQHRLAGRAERRLVALVLQRQLEHGLVDEPPLLARDLEREHLVRVVVDGQSLRPARRVVGVRLRGVAEVRLELPAVARERQPEVVQPLEHDRGAGFELREHARDVGDARERPPAARRGRSCSRTTVAPAFTSRKPGVRIPVSVISRSTSRTERRSSKRPSSPRGTTSGFCSQCSARKRSASTGAIARESGGARRRPSRSRLRRSRSSHCRPCRRRSCRCRRRRHRPRRSRRGPRPADTISSSVRVVLSSSIAPPWRRAFGPRRLQRLRRSEPV